MGIANGFWWEKLLKAFVSGQSGVRSGNSMTTRCVVNAHTLNTFLSLAKSKHFSRTISGLFEGGKILVSSFGEEMKPIFFFSLQLDGLRSMKYNDTVNIFNNYRPVQALFGRQVKASFDMITIAPPVTTTAPPVTTVAPPVTTVAPSVTTAPSSVTTTAPSVTTDGVALKISNVVLVLVLLLGAAYFH